MYSNSLARHFSPLFHAKCLLSRLTRLLPVRSWLKYFYQWILAIIMYINATYWAKLWWLLSIFITFKDFLLTWNNFSFDSVKVYDGASIQSPSLGEYCGNSIPTSLVSTNNQLFLKFKTDFSVDGRGFMIEYSPASRLYTPFENVKKWLGKIHSKFCF